MAITTAWDTTRAPTPPPACLRATADPSPEPWNSVTIDACASTLVAFVEIQRKRHSRIQLAGRQEAVSLPCPCAGQRYDDQCTLSAFSAHPRSQRTLQGMSRWRSALQRVRRATGTDQISTRFMQRSWLEGATDGAVKCRGTALCRRIACATISEISHSRCCITRRSSPSKASAASCAFVVFV